jgi:FkbM family methyltransferase
MDIKKIKNQFNENLITKVEFINLMHGKYKQLFDFSENLIETEIQKIEIDDKGVYFTSRPSKSHPGELKFTVDILDKRITPYEAFNFNQYELEDSTMLYNIVNNCNVIFDIGANIGWYSLHLAKKLPNSIIYSFEPIPDTFNKFQKNLELNNCQNLIINNIPLSDTIQNLTFYYSPTATGATSSENITENTEALRIECKTDTIDTFIKNNSINGLDFIKCDVEGAELMVFKGGYESINKYKPIIFSEMLRKWSSKFGYHPNDIIDYFSKFGYHCYLTSSNKLLQIDQITDETIETNFFFLHPLNHHEVISKNS